jgi:hypothetical protein
MVGLVVSVPEVPATQEMKVEGSQFQNQLGKGNRKPCLKTKQKAQRLGVSQVVKHFLVSMKPSFQFPVSHQKQVSQKSIFFKVMKNICLYQQSLSRSVTEISIV